MFDFRYHALSLVAVFLALAVGLLLGIAIGDSELVSSAETSLREDLRGDVERASAEADTLRGELTRRQAFEMQAYPLLVGERLQGRRVAVITMHAAGDRTFDDVRNALTPSGAELSSVARLRLPPDLGRLAAGAVGTRYEGLAEDPDLLEPFARRVGESLVQGGRLIADSCAARCVLAAGELGRPRRSSSSAASRTSPRSAPTTSSSSRTPSSAASWTGALRHPRRRRRATDTDPSQIPWYQSHGLASVDDVDEVAGRAALVITLAVGADGHYGIKSTRDSLLPDITVSGP